MKLDPGFDIGFRSISGPSAVGGASQYYSSWHVHWYAYPLIYWMEIVADFLCLESGSIDILYISEIDPLWQDSELTAIINPEAVLFRSEEHTSELQSLMRISYAVFCLKKKTINKIHLYT